MQTVAAGDFGTRLRGFFDNVIVAFWECTDDSISFADSSVCGVKGSLCRVLRWHDGDMQDVEDERPPEDADTETRLMQRAPSLLEVVFPGYYWDAALVSISAIQCAAFLGSLTVGSVGVFPTACGLYSLGASFGPSIADGALWRLFAPIWLHAGLGHLVPNILLQMRMGFAVESQLGSSRFTSVYVLSGIFGNLISAAAQPLKMSVGASTSVLGLFGASTALLCLDWTQKGSASRLQWLAAVGFMVALQAATGGSDMWGHVAGFTAGFCLTWLMAPERVVNNGMSRSTQQLVSASSFTFLLGAVGLSALALSMQQLPDVLALECAS
mmetsp:Transcript_4058/g.8789  ORF Transcript_4058/g.8789 Transcript_4058/m.8789 type:complete len:326 (-) Transcript_4058:47-1024(-)